MKNTTISMETAVKNLQTGINSLGITMREASEGLQRSAKFLSSEQVIQQSNAYFSGIENTLSRGFSTSKL